MPRPFQFSLQKVLSYRLQLEEEAKLAMAKAQLRYKRQVERAQRLRGEIAAGEITMSQKAATHPEEAFLWRAYLERLQSDLQQAEQEVLQRARELNKARRELIMRSKERQLLEKLKQNKKIRHDKEEREKEQKELDEMATLRYGRNAF